MIRTKGVMAAVVLAATATLAACNDGGSGSLNVAPTPTPTATPTPIAATRTIVFVWDGLRPDDVSATDTPNLYALQQAGVQFADNHSTYPTFTMMNGAAFATGSFPATTGFYGNTFWTPPQGSGNTIPAGNGAGGTAADYVDPVFTEDYAILDTLNSYYGNQLLLVKSLFATAQAAGITTATIGKSGAAYIQDLGQASYFVDENTVRPRSLATELQAANIALPLNTTKTYSDVTLAATNGNPTARAGYATFNTTAYDPNGALTVAARDSSDTSGAPEDAANKYMMSVFTNYILPKKNPMLSLIWFRTPDNVEHGYGPGTANVRAGLRSQDARLGELMAALKAQGLDSTTNIVIVSDHGHSTVSGPTSLYPLRAITAAAGGSAASLGGQSGTGFSFSGDVRTADLLTYRGLKAYDGSGCTTSAMYGLSATGTPTVPLRVDTSGTLCGAANTKYQAVSATLANPVASFKVPAPGSLPANAVVVAANGGSDYLYVPSHDPALIQQIVTILQRREEYGAIFVDSRYGTIPGTLAMKDAFLENATRRNNGQPDIVVSFAWDENTTVQGKNGIEFESAQGQRGMHGSFGITDVHNTLIGYGPSFQKSKVVNGPSGNVDVAPTVAWLLGLSMPQADGRVLNEALVNPRSTASLSVNPRVITPANAVTGLAFELPTDPSGATKDTSRTGGSYSIQLAVKDVTVDGKTYRYFDYARAVRQ
ncbi:phosphodiesterase [Sphingomonas sp. MA1305]|uniref:alkaline phosphatase family protein n=1 Tax=Sphingomonas sp. MA1305 TaxID=2479204 RepID=UPI001E3CC51A|nr:alkaline phosphatase family protein [Sphingomonas sp. MA1305]MBI0475896.1 phosphodiesterase [Sphingomonas sp. MA1305]